MSAPYPPGEPARIAALRAFGILDTGDEQVYDDITALASHICDAPIALISFVDEERQWFKSRVGLAVTETPREHSFCAHALLLQPGEVLIVPDAIVDERFSRNPLVTDDPQMRFYAGAPLVTPGGDVLGTLCVIDRRPRELTPVQIAALRSLSRLVMAQLELRAALATARTENERRERSGEILRVEMAARRTAEALQQATERRTRLIVDNALDAVISIDQDSRITFWNSQAEMTFGWPADAAIGRRLGDLIIPPALREAHTEGMRRYLTTGEATVLNRRIEVVALNRDGRQFPIELSITPLREGNDLTFSAFLRDISARKRWEQLLATQYEVSQVLGAATKVAEAAPRVLGKTCEFLGWEVGALWLLDAAAALKCVHLWLAPGLNAPDFAVHTLSATFRSGEGLPGRVLEQGQPVWVPEVATDSNFPRASGASRAGLHSAIALPVMTQGRVGGVVEFFSRQTIPFDREVVNTVSGVAGQLSQFIERAQAEAALRLSEGRTRAVVENMLEGLIVVGPEMRVLEANYAFGRIFGYDREALSGMRVTHLMPEAPEYQDHERLADKYSRSLGRVTEHEGRRRDGEVFPVQLQVYEVNTPEGRLIAAHVRDLSQERESDRLKQQFVASVSHELRTPLTAIRGALGLLLTKAAGPLPEAARELVALGERNAVRLVAIIDDLLDFERLDLGLLPLACETFPLDRAVDRAIESVAPMAGEAAIVLEGAPASLTVFGDESRVVQVLVNLLSNSIKFSPAGSLVEVRAAESGSFVEIRVRDRGRGVPEAMREAVFEPFRQVEGSDARRHRGSGLGLAICRTIVNQHGGEIGVECPADGGSTFWFTLPRRHRSLGPEPGHPPDESGPGPGTMHVL